MTILALDPGPERTGWVNYGRLIGRVLSAGIASNDQVLAGINHHCARFLAIEMVASYGMPVGREVFETVWWAGRFTQAWSQPDSVIMVYRQEVKLYLCGSVKAKDANIRQALIDVVGHPGTKKNPGPTHGVSGHMWAALGVAVTAYAKLEEISLRGKDAKWQQHAPSQRLSWKLSERCE